MSLRIGRIDYANCTPIFAALERFFDCGGYEFIRDVPSAINRMLAEGTVDLSPSSSLEYGRSPGKYLLLPGLSISSIGPVRSVYLFSRLPLEDLDGRVIGVSSESATSVALLKILLARFHGFSNEFRIIPPERYGTALEESPALLLIGNSAMKWEMERGDLYRYDLGDLWHDFTGLPFVFALWIIRRDVAAARRDVALQIGKHLEQAKRLSLTILDELAPECGERFWMDRERLLAYWRNISYDLTPLHVEGVTRFYRYARELGILGEVPEIAFLR